MNCLDMQTEVDYCMYIHVTETTGLKWSSIMAWSYIYYGRTSLSKHRPRWM